MPHIKFIFPLICAFALSYCADTRSEAVFNTATQKTGDEAASGLPKLIGRPAPAFEVTTLDGRKVSLAQYRGKAVLLNFWATWCGACKLEMPWLADLRNQYASKGFEVLGVLTDRAPAEKVAAISTKYGVTYPILMCNHATAQAYGGLPFLPSTFYIDRKGRVVAEMAEASSKAEIEADIQKALNEPGQNR